tara:strand:- start:171 stop:290 length:120 start_codon:yes stop_codon:yes gene_type:complete
MPADIFEFDGYKKRRKYFVKSAVSTRGNGKAYGWQDGTC